MWPLLPPPTVCPMYQVNQEFGIDFSIPVLYFTQLVGLALGIELKRLKIGMELVFPTLTLST
jgi:heterodisulfide reductase subunit B